MTWSAGSWFGKRKFVGLGIAGAFLRAQNPGCPFQAQPIRLDNYRDLFGDADNLPGHPMMDPLQLALGMRAMPPLHKKNPTRGRV